MFVENEHKRTFLENVVKDHNAKKNTMEVTIASNQTKSRGYLIYDQKLGNNFKRWKKALLSHLTRSYKALCQSNGLLLPNSHPAVCQLDCLCNGRCIGESKKKVLTRCIDNQQDSIKGSYLVPMNTPKSAMDNLFFIYFYFIKAFTNL